MAQRRADLAHRTVGFGRDIPVHVVDRQYIGLGRFLEIERLQRHRAGQAQRNQRERQPGHAAGIEARPQHEAAQREQHDAAGDGIHVQDPERTHTDCLVLAASCSWFFLIN